MKKYIWFGIGLIAALPLSAFALMLAPSFSDVREDAWYHNSVINTSLQGWITGYGNGKFGPENPVLRAELATILERYDKNVRSMHDQLKDILCLNQGQSLNELGMKVVDQKRYENSLKNFCESNWRIGECFQYYDAQTGTYSELKMCP